MATEILKLTAQIVISHASMSELTPKELVEELKEVYKLLSSLEGGLVLPVEAEAERGLEAEVVKKPPIPLQDIVKDKYVVCLECGKQMRTLKAHLRKAHHFFAATVLIQRSTLWSVKNIPSNAASWPKKRAWGPRAPGGARLPDRPWPGRGRAAGPPGGLRAVTGRRDLKRSLFLLHLFALISFGRELSPGLEFFALEGYIYPLCDCP